MHLTIRWKFILSIGITLLVTYLGLLTWDYWWQRNNASVQMQRIVADAARSRADILNQRIAAVEPLTNSLAKALASAPPRSFQELQATVAQHQLGGNNQVTIAFEPQVASGAGLAPAYTTAGRGGPGRGGGRGGPQDARGPGDRRGGPEAAGGPTTRGGSEPRGPGGQRGRGGGPQGGRGSLGATFFALEPLANFDRVGEPAYARAVEQRKEVWCDPHPVAGPPGMIRATFSAPIIIGETVVGVVITQVDPQQEFVPFGNRGNRSGGRGPNSPSAEASELTETALRDYSVQFTLIGSEGHVISPPASAESPRPSIVEWAKSNNMPDLADDLQAKLDGENSSVHVRRVEGASQLVSAATSAQAHWIAFAPIAQADWVVTAAISEPQYLDPTLKRLWHRALFLIGGLAVLLAVTTFVSIRVSRPIEKMAAAVNQLAAGNLDARVKGVSSRDELGQLAGAFNTMTGQLKQHIAALTEQTAAREIVESELRIARQIQTDLLPKTFPPFPNRTEFDLHAVNVPAQRVAGDFYDFFFTSEEKLIVVIADVSGKGVPAALLMAVTRTIVRNLAMEGLSPLHIAERANTMLIQDISESMFVTMFLCEYNTRTGKVIYVNTGHPKPYRITQTGPKPFGDVTGALLGVYPASADWPFEQGEEQLEVGEMLLLFTDGVTEARSPDGSMLRSAGVEPLLKQYRDEPVEGICRHLVDDLNRYQAGQPADDITLVALRRRR